jgi:hypothetical protein
VGKDQYSMKYLKMAFGLAVVAGLMAVVASPAMAVPRWVHCVKSTTGKYNSGLCTTAGTGWETKEITETSEVTTSTSSLELEDTKATGGATAVKCEGIGTGWVANLSTTSIPGEDGIATVYEPSIKCTFITGKNGSCEAAVNPTATPRNLPWGTKLKEEGTEVRDELISGGRTQVGKGAPGWAVECRVAGILKVQDICEISGRTVNVIANRTNGKTEFIFDKKTEEEKPKAECSIGGTEAGRVTGTILSSLRSGNALWILAPNLKT